MSIIWAGTTGSRKFTPDRFFEGWQKTDHSVTPVVDEAREDGFRQAIVDAFDLPQNDDFVYHAVMSVTLEDVQRAINAGSANGLYSWYRDEKGEPLPPPPPSDITAYTMLFLNPVSPTKSLTNFCSNAKKSSLRSTISTYLLSTRQPPSFSLPKAKQSPLTTNPYLAFWAWSCQHLRWAGPLPSPNPLVGSDNLNYGAGVAAQPSHPLLPIMMHHFSCVCPTHESLRAIAHYANSSPSGPRPILDMGSGSGYWTYLLRRPPFSCPSVIAVDSGQSSWRTRWIGDTVVTDGIDFLTSRNNGGRRRGGSSWCDDGILLLVYPIVGGGGFTERVLRAYKGDVIVVAGTQSRNGYTGFANMTVEEYLCDGAGGETTAEGNWRKDVQVPLPSFAGKDEALFVFVRVAKKDGEGQERRGDVKSGNVSSREDA